jgi:amino acid adenylation domain-containing protein
MTEEILWDDRFDPPLRGNSIHEMFDWCVQAWPDAIAIRVGELRITYADLARASMHYAAELEDRGVGPGHIVPVLMPRTPEFFAILLAILRRGAAYAALDMKWSAVRLAEIIDSIDTPVIVTGEPQLWPGSVFVPGDVFGTVPDQARRGSSAVPVRPDDPCAVFFTSGTTGPAKGVVTAHRSHTRLFDAWEFAPHGSGAVVPQALSATWDAFDLDGWAVLLGGGTVVPVEDAAELPERLAGLIADHGVNTIWIPTALFHTMVETFLDAFAGLRMVGMGGERLSSQYARRFLERHPDIPLYNFYGPVECTAVATSHRVRMKDCAPGHQVPLGRALSSTGVHVLNDETLCETSEIGEICLTGPGVAHGYLGRPDLNVGRFVSLHVDGATRKAYRTGDLGHWDDEGNLHFDGRIDRQVKVRGRRIEIEELERAAEMVSGVGSCAVVPLFGPAGLCEDLALFYVSGNQVSREMLREALADLLPGYMVPTYIHQMSALPIVADRKVDASALSTLAATLRAEGAAGAPPETGTDVQVAGMFRTILKVGSAGRDSSFFALGGNSLNAAQLSILIESELGVRLKLSQIFANPTVGKLAQLIDEKLHADLRPGPEDGEPVADDPGFQK